MTFKQQLKDRRACHDALDWVGRKSAKTAWEACERGDWMLWALRQFDVLDRRMSVTLACEFAERVVHRDKSGKGRIAIDTAREWLEGEATAKQCKDAADAAAYAADAAYAVYAAYAADYAGDAAYAAAAAAHAALGAHDERKAQADIIRAHISWNVVEAALERIEG